MAQTALQVLDTFLRDPATLGGARQELPPPDKWPLLLAAVSGGADSVVLFDCLHRLSTAHRFRLDVIHINHGLRGTDAEKDAAFVRNLAAERNMRCHVIEGDTRARMADQGLSLEEAARQIRYEGFVRIAYETDARAIVIAHHLDDDVETLLMRLITGASLQALAGMEPIGERHGVAIWRPFLRTPQSALYAHLKEHDLAFRHDVSNLDASLLRNRVRLELLPKLRSNYNPQVVRTLGRLLQELKLLRTTELPDVRPPEPRTCATDPDAVEVQESPLVPAEEWQFPVMALQGLEVRERWGLWKGVLRGLGIPSKRLNRATFEDLDTLISRSDGTLAIHLPGGLEARRTYGTLVFGPRQADEEVPDPVRLPLTHWEWTDRYPGWVILMEEDEALNTAELAPAPPKPSKRWWEATLFQGDLLVPLNAEALTIRSRHKGDALALSGEAGHVSVKEWFIDTKLPRLFRERWPVVATEEDEVLWVPGLPWKAAERGARQKRCRLTAIKTAHWG